MSIHLEKDASPIRVLVDTNIWLDYFLARGQHHEAVSRFLAKTYDRDDIALYVASLSLKDLAHQIASLLKLDTRRAGNEVTADVAAAARDAADGCRQVDRYVQLLIEASRGEAGEKTGRRIDASEFAQRISRATA